MCVFDGTRVVHLAVGQVERGAGRLLGVFLSLFFILFPVSLF